MSLGARDFLTPDVLRVPAAASPGEYQCEREANQPLVFAVFEDDSFLGLVDSRTALRHPEQTFADLCHAVPYPVSADTTLLQGILREMARRQREAELLAELARTINASLDLDSVLRRVVEGARELCRGDTGAIALRDSPSEAMIIRYPVGARYQKFERIRIEPGKGVGGQVLATGQPFRTDHYAADPRVSKDYIDVIRTDELVAMMAVPIRIGDHVEGLLYVTSRSPRPFTDQDEAILLRLADHAAIALENARLFGETRERLKETETLLDLSRALSSTIDLHPLLRHFLRQVVRTLEADSVGVWLVDQITGQLKPFVGYRIPPHLLEYIRGLRIDFRESVFHAEAFASKRAMVSSNVSEDPRIADTLKATWHHQAQLFAPMVAKDQAIGAIMAVWWDRSREFSERELALVEAMGRQVGVAVENARLYRETREVAERLRLLGQSVAGLGEVIVITDLEGRIVFVNEAIKGVFGYEAREVVGQYSRVLWAPSTPSGQKKYVMEVTAAGGWQGEVRGGRADGSEFPAALATRPVRDEAGQPVAFVGVVRDITKEKELQAQLLQAEKLRALGEMAGGIAHDFNNLLTVMLGRAQLLLNQTQDPALQRQLRVIERAALDGGQTVRRIQDFTRVRPARPFQAVNLSQVVGEVVELTRSRWKDEAQAKGIHYDILVNADPPLLVAGDPSELREALTNILFNALDAMPEGGRVTFQMGVEGDRVSCAVIDTGVGMTEEVRRRVFDPFFTTKGEKGSGLGLSVVYGIIARHGGDVEVQSQVGRGSAFTIRLPVGGNVTESPSIPPSPRSNRGAKILLIDDEEEVREVLIELLVSDGYVVAACADGRSGLSRLQQEPFDLVISDLGMPGLSGWEVARLVKHRYPGIPVALITGWGDRIDAEEVRTKGVDFLVAKPFKLEDITAMVVQALSRRTLEKG